MKIMGPSQVGGTVNMSSSLSFRLMSISWVKFIPGYMIMIPYAGLVVAIIGLSLFLRLIGKRESAWVHPEVDIPPAYCQPCVGLAS
jgi:hypothetical protein